MTSLHSFLWGNDPMSESLETSSPCQDSTHLPTPCPFFPLPVHALPIPGPFFPLLGPPAQVHTLQPPSWSAPRAAFPAQPTVPRRGRAHWAAGSGWRASFRRPGARTGQWPSRPGGKGRSLLCCHVTSSTLLSARESLVFCFLLKQNICSGHLIKTRPLSLASHDIGEEHHVPRESFAGLCRSGRVMEVPLCLGWSTA